MVGGTGVALAPDSVVREAELFVAVDLEGGGRRPEATVRLASAVRRDWLAALFPGAVTVEETTGRSTRRARRVVARRRERYVDLTLAESVARRRRSRRRPASCSPRPCSPTPRCARASPAPHAALLARAAFLARAMPELGLPSDTDALLADAVRAGAAGRRRVAELAALDLGGRAAGRPHARRSAPRSSARRRPSIRLPTGRSVAVAYEADGPPTIAARIQELFGLTATPRLAAGRVPLVIQLLAPNQRPVQVTDDLASFWRTTYFEVRKQLRGRYPKHAWPDDPLSATPVARPSRRS